MTQEQTPATDHTADMLGRHTLDGRVNTAHAIVKQAHDTCDPYIDQLLHIEWQAVKEEDIRNVDEQLAGLQGRINDAIKAIDKQYKPLSAAWDEYRSNFTKAKENLELLKSKANYPRVKMANELDRRIELAKKDAAKTSNIEKEKIDVATAFNQHMMNKLFEAIKATTQKMYSSFLQTPADRFPLFVQNLEGWSPDKVLHIDTITLWAKEFKWEFKHMDPIEPHADASFKPNDWMQALINHLLPEKQKLLQLVPFRQAQFQSGQVDDNYFTSLQDQSQQAIQQTEQQSTQQLQEVQAAATTNAIYEVSSTVVIPQQNKGIRKKEVLAPANHDEWRAIVNWYMEKTFPHLSPAELNKNLGFMLRVANNIMQATGEMPPGKVTTTEAFSTRAAKTKQ